MLEAQAQNIVSINDVTASVGDTIKIAVNVQNVDEFVAFQSDIVLPDVCIYQQGSVKLSERAEDHTLSANLLDGNVLRVIAFSISQKSFSGNSGELITFNVILKDQPGDYIINISNCVLANSNSDNILTGINPGNLIVKKKSIIKKVQLNVGWNLVSAPLVKDNMNYLSVFPTAISHPYEFTDSYHKIDTLRIFSGYWIKFSADLLQQIEGLESDENRIPVYQGWNLIGSFSDLVSTGEMLQVPNGITSSEFFEFDGGYKSVDELQPGKGYWIKTMSDGYLERNDQPSKMKYELLNNANYEVEFNASNGKGSSQLLKIGFDSTGTDGLDPHLGEQELPPPPPSEIFFIRFALPNSFISSYSDIRFGELNGIYTYEHELQFQLGEDATELILNWDQPSGVNITIQDLFGGVIVNENYLPGTNEFSLNNTNITSLKLIVSYSNITSIDQKRLPIEYTLYQNYPNPFNPTTMIEYSVSKNVFVTLKIYDLLGREIKTLVNEEKSAGKYKVSFDGSETSSGIYIYSLKAGEFYKTRKLLLLK